LGDIYHESTRVYFILVKLLLTNLKNRYIFVYIQSRALSRPYTVHSSRGGPYETRCSFLLLCLCSLAWAGNNALNLNGTTGSRAGSIHGTGLLALTDFTIEAWTNLSTTAASGDNWIWSPQTWYWGMARFSLRGSTGVYFHFVNNFNGAEYTISQTTADNRGAWVYWAAVRQADSLKVYRNGVVVGQAVCPDSCRTRLFYTEYMRIGERFKGLIDEVRISKTARTAAEITAAYNSGSGARLTADANTISLWHFDEGLGAAAYDYTAGHNDLTLDSANWAGGMAFGTAPQDLAVMHADFHGRLGLPIRLGVGGAAATDKIRVQLTSDLGMDQTVFTHDAPLAAEYTFVLDLRTLPAANYTLHYRILSQTDQVLKEVTETFAKPYSGIPVVGINEYNGICVNGQPFFPTTSWGLNASSIATWAGQHYVNSLCGMNFGDPTLAGFQTYLNAARAESVRVIGPGDGHQWDGGSHAVEVTPGNWQYTTIDLNKLAGYVRQFKDHAGVLMWLWDDEPDMGGPSPAQIRAGTDTCHANDPQHPTAFNLMGSSAVSEGWIITGRKFCFPLVTDIYAFDYYPLNSGDTTMAKYSSVMDRYRLFTHDLVPIMSWVEVTDINSGRMITPRELRMEAWLNVAHGMKGVQWFHYFVTTPQANLAAMATFTNQVNTLAPALTGPDYAGSVADQELDGGQVDIICKADQDQAYLIAVNVKNKTERVRFTVSGMASNTVTVFDESRTITAAGGVFEDTFDSLAVHIYRISTVTGIADKGPQARNPRGTITIGPNPSSREITVTDLSGAVRGTGQIKIYDLAGALMATPELHAGRAALSLELPQGVFVVEVAGKMAGRIVIVK
jgi:hypothetical protein